MRRARHGRAGARAAPLRGVGPARRLRRVERHARAARALRCAAGEAVDLFVYRIGRELGSLAAALGGLDALVFTGGIGENAAPIRARVCRDASWLGLDLDESANARGGPRISPPGAASPRG